MAAKLEYQVNSRGGCHPIDFVADGVTVRTIVMRTRTLAEKIARELNWALNQQAPGYDTPQESGLDTRTSDMVP